MKIRDRLILTLLLITTITVVLSIFVAFIQTRRFVTSQVTQQLEAIADVKEAQFDTILQSKLEVYDVISNNKDLNDFVQGSKEESISRGMVQFGNDYINDSKSIEGIFLVDSDGQQIFGTDEGFYDWEGIVTKANIDEKRSSKIVTFDSKSKGLLVIGEVMDEMENETYLVLRFSSEEVLSALVGFSGLGDTGEVLIAKRTIEGDAEFLHSRRFEAAETSKAIINKTDINVPITQSLLGNELTMPNAIDYRGEPVLAATRYLEDLDWGLVIKQDSEEIFSVTKDLTIFSIFVVVVLGGGLGAGVYFSVSSLTKQIEELTSISHKVSEGELDLEIPQRMVDRADELGILARSFDRMMKSVSMTYKELDQKVKERTEKLSEVVAKVEAQNEELEKIQSSLHEQIQETKKFKQAVDAARDGIVITDIDTKIIYVNKSWEELNKRSFKEVKGKSPKIVASGKTPRQVFRNMWQSLGSGKTFFSEEFINKRKDGGEYEAEIAVYPIQEKGKNKFFVGVIQDISKRKRVESMKTEFLSLASHQLRTPLTGMRWNIEMLVDGDVGELTEEQSKVANEIYESNQRLVNLVNDLLDVSKIESGKLVLDPALSNLKRLVDSVVEEMKPLLKGGKQLVYDINPNFPDMYLDYKFVRNVFINLISNAIKYTDDDGLVEIYVSRKETEVICQVTDNGAGIPPGDHDRVFDKFYRGDNILKKDVDGTGLGMYLVKKVIEEMGGRIWFKSEIDKGTTFWFTIPIKSD